jgi:hypothetical protein
MEAPLVVRVRVEDEIEVLSVSSSDTVGDLVHLICSSRPQPLESALYSLSSLSNDTFVKDLDLTRTFELGQQLNALTFDLTTSSETIYTDEQVDTIPAAISANICPKRNEEEPSESQLFRFASNIGSGNWPVDENMLFELAAMYSRICGGGSVRKLLPNNYFGKKWRKFKRSVDPEKSTLYFLWCVSTAALLPRGVTRIVAEYVFSGFYFFLFFSFFFFFFSQRRCFV